MESVINIIRRGYTVLFCIIFGISDSIANKYGEDIITILFIILIVFYPKVVKISILGKLIKGLSDKLQEILTLANKIVTDVLFIFFL